ncbi:MAG: hypothetical protein KatS3mg110_1468 [Pirellulaceae bacterium]|nr:MAG: hypothetical protein KatS3mg110_1468 [Pirellulaceae bacterium]
MKVARFSWFKHATVRVLLTILVAGMLLCCGRAAADLKDDFLLRYEVGSQALLAEYSRCMMTVVCRRENWPAYKETGGKRNLRIVSRRKDAYIRVDATVLRDDRAGQVDAGCVVRCAGPQMAFRADREGVDAPFELSYVYAATDDPHGLICGEFRFVNGPFVVMASTLKDLLRYRAVKVTGLSEVNLHGERFVEIRWEDAPQSEFRGAGWIRLMPDRHWAIREWAVWERGKLPTAADYRASRGQVDYEGEHNGVPIMKRYRWWIEEGPEKKVSMSETTEVESIQFGTIPDTEFTPAALGIATPREVHNGYWFLALFAGGVLCLLIAVYLARTIRSRT